MDGVRTYLLSICGAALLCGIADRILGKKGPAALARMLTGLFLVLTVLGPLKNISSGMLEQLELDFSDEAAQAVAQGEAVSKNALAEIIKQQTQTYILEKAKQLQADIQVSVTVSEDDLPAPVSVRITGSVAPAAKSQLQQIIADQLGIAKENQQWT